MGSDRLSCAEVIAIDPRKEDFFTRVIEYRKENKADDRLHHFLKILANSTSYGTYLELNPTKIDPSKRPIITVHSGDRIFEQPAPDIVEEPGKFFFPVLGALITSGGRLLLALIERCVRDAGGSYLCCDTDPLTIVPSKTGDAVQMPDGAPPVKALWWMEVDAIVSRFDSLFLIIAKLCRTYCDSRMKTTTRVAINCSYSVSLLPPSATHSTLKHTD